MSVRNAGLKRELREDSLAHGNSIITRDSAYQVRRIEACHRAMWVLQYVQRTEVLHRTKYGQLRFKKL
jgi:hypothetical protein